MRGPEKYSFNYNIMSINFKSRPGYQENKLRIIKAICSNVVPPRGGFFVPKIPFRHIISPYPGRRPLAQPQFFYHTAPFASRSCGQILLVIQASVQISNAFCFQIVERAIETQVWMFLRCCRFSLHPMCVKAVPGYTWIPTGGEERTRLATHWRFKPHYKSAPDR